MVYDLAHPDSPAVLSFRTRAQPTTYIRSLHPFDDKVPSPANLQREQW